MQTTEVSNIPHTRLYMGFRATHRYMSATQNLPIKNQVMYCNKHRSKVVDEYADIYEQSGNRLCEYGAKIHAVYMSFREMCM